MKASFASGKCYKLSFALILVMVYSGIFAQAPEKIHFQITVKDYKKHVLANKVMGASISVISQNSEILYQERQVVHTNSRGLASFYIGAGTDKQGSLTSINWGSDADIFYIRTAFDPNGGTSYSIVNHTRINSVPFALQARSVADYNEKDPEFKNSLAAAFRPKNIAKWDEATRFRQQPGDKVGGGIVFYVDSSGEDGLIVSPNDISAGVPWMPSADSLTECQSYTDGAGNSAAIVQQTGTGQYAAYLCDTLTIKGKGEWYLPSLDELSLLFDSRYQVNKRAGTDQDVTTQGLYSERYWSSTQYDGNLAFLFNNGHATPSAKEDLAGVRAIRKFSGLFDVHNYTWTYLGGPEEENGDPVRIIENTNGDLLLDVKGRRGTVFRPLPEMKLPAKVTFNLRTTYNPDANEPPYELFGTGDFRIYVGGPNKNEPVIAMNESDLGDFEGVQFRIFPHVDQSPIRRYTYNDGDRESHTSTSIWIRYIDPDRITGAGGEPHTGLVSDACQNRNKPPTHNCGWARVALLENGFGLENGEETKVTITITHEYISLEANGRVFSVNIPELASDDSYAGDILRFDRLTDFAVGHTNISRGYITLSITDLKVLPVRP